jgi:peptidoglycan/LPS O-acetylase OafA/YrhL
MLRAASILALVFGSFLTVAEIARNHGNWQWWPFWLVDFVAAGLLIAGAWLALRKRPSGSAVLCGAWGFTTCMFYMSFWSHVEHIDETAEGNFAQGPLTVAIGILWGISIVGFVLALGSARRPAA